jgi:hypothetical protein
MLRRMPGFSRLQHQPCLINAPSEVLRSARSHLGRVDDLQALLQLARVAVERVHDLVILPDSDLPGTGWTTRPARDRQAAGEERLANPDPPPLTSTLSALHTRTQPRHLRHGQHRPEVLSPRTLRQCRDRTDVRTLLLVVAWCGWARMLVAGQRIIRSLYQTEVTSRKSMQSSHGSTRIARLTRVSGPSQEHVRAAADVSDIRSPTCLTGLSGHSSCTATGATAIIRQ